MNDIILMTSKNSNTIIPVSKNQMNEDLENLLFKDLEIKVDRKEKIETVHRSFYFLFFYFHPFSRFS